MNFDCFTIDESNQVKISRVIMRCQGYFLKIALGTRLFEIVLMISSLCFIDVISMIYLYCSSPDHADKFREYLSSKHPNINFSIKKEEDGRLPFLDINIFRENDKFATFIEKRPSVGFIPTSKVLYLKYIKLV